MTSTAESPEGLRRGKRHRYRPLEWWRQEKVIYGRRESGITLVPHIKAILRIPKEEPVPLGKQKRKRRGMTKARSKSETVEGEEEELPIVYNPEEGWDDKTGQQGVVLDFVSREEVQRREAFACFIFHWVDLTYLWQALHLRQKWSSPEQQRITTGSSRKYLATEIS